MLVRFVRSPRGFTVAVAVAAAALGSLGCGKSKVDQCNAFVDKANHAMGVTNNVRIDAEDPKVLEADATKIDAEAAALASEDIKDEKLAGYRDQFSSNMKKLATGFRDLAKLHAEIKAAPDSTAVETRVKKLEADMEALEKSDSKLVDDVNVYCTGSK